MGGLLGLLALGLFAGAWDWAFSPVDQGNLDRGQFNSVAVAEDGRWHAAYYRFASQSEGERNLVYATNPNPDGGGSWTTTIVDEQSTTGSYASIALDAGGNPHIAYYESEFANLKHAWNTGGGWNTEFVDVAGVVGQFSSIGTKGNDVYIAYYDATTPALKLAVQDDGGPWQFTLVDTAGVPGLYASLITRGTPQIAYYDLERRNLMHARQAGPDWVTAVVDSFQDVGRFIDIDIDELGNTGISYYHVTQEDLKYAFRTGSTGPWTLATVESSGDVGSGTSLIFDSRQLPHITYYDRTNGQLKMAHQPTGNLWTIDVVSYGSGDYGRFTSLYMAPDKLPRIAFYDEIAGEFWYARGTGSVVGVEEPGLALPALSLRALPNPARAATSLRFRVDTPGEIALQVFDITGRLVRTIAHERVEPGEYAISWDGRSEAGRPVASGRYIATVRTPSGQATTGIVLLR